MPPLLRLVLATTLLGLVSDGHAAPPSPPALAEPVALRCDFRVDPLGVDSTPPRLSWNLAAIDPATRGLSQTAYRLLVASSPDLLARDEGDLWDSGHVVSNQSILVPYAGRPLRSGQACHWKVRVWTLGDRSSSWSRPATWTMGLLDPADWRASWIGAPVSPEARGLGYHAAEARRADDVKWVQVDLGQSHPLSSIRLHPMSHDKRDGFGFPLRFKIEASDDPAFATATLLADHTAADFANPGAKPVAFAVAPGVSARHVRVTATKLWLRDTLHAFALRELEVFSDAENIARRAPVTALDSVENYGWTRVALTDGDGKTAASLLLRREFPVRPRLVRALVHVTGLGQYELSVNGRRVGEDLLSPGWTNYRKAVLYDTHDVTALLRPGSPNAVGILLGAGMYNVTGGRYAKFTGTFGPLKTIAHLRLDYADGTSETIGTDAAWRVAPGPLTFSCVYGGEDHDARLLPAGWDAPGFAAASAWSAAAETTGPGGVLRGVSHAAPPLRAFESFWPVSRKELRPGVVVHDLGQNASVMPRVAVRGPAGSIVRITPSEVLNADGSLNRRSVGNRPSYWQYTLAGGPDAERWFPRFFYHGSRYFQVECLPAEAGGELPVLESLEGVVVHGSVPGVGEFTTSSDLFNRIHSLVRWAQRSNLVSVITDCPHRERLGWLEQYHLNGPSLRYGFDLAALYTKCFDDMADAQLPDGLVPDIAPEYPVFSGGFRDSPEWGSAFILAAWQQYQFTGDAAVFTRHYEGMKRYLAYLEDKSKDGVLNHGLGDWYDLGPKPPGQAQLTPVKLTATAIYYEDIRTMARIATLLGRADDAATYDSMAEKVAAAFNAALYHPETRSYATGSQTSNAMPLVLGLVPSEDRPAVLEAVVADVRARGDAITAGDVGYRYLIRALADGGRSDVIHAMNHQSEKPGYGYQLARGATSLAEAWDARPDSSQNHFMLGQIMEWFYHDLAGIQPDPDGPGFKRVVIRPAIVGDLAWTRARYDSPHGRIVSAWKREGSRLTLEVTIPPNSTATVFVPTSDPTTVTEGGAPVARAKAVTPLPARPGHAVFAVGSGTYVFASDI